MADYFLVGDPSRLLTLQAPSPEECSLATERYEDGFALQVKVPMPDTGPIQWAARRLVERGTLVAMRGEQSDGE